MLLRGPLGDNRRDLPDGGHRRRRRSRRVSAGGFASGRRFPSDWLCSIGGLLLFYAAPWADGLGLALTAVVLFLHFWRAARQGATGPRGKAH